mgnify:FL=1
MVQILEPLPKETVTPDRGKEFTNHQDLTDKLKVEVYFPDPQRLGNEEQMRIPMDYYEGIFPKGVI